MADVLVGAERSVKGPYVQWLSGASGTLIREWTSSLPNRFGESCNVAGDGDGDGIADYAASAPQDMWGQGGYVRLYSGKLGTTLHTLDNPANVNSFGASIGPVGDVNGNGVKEIAVAGHYWDAVLGIQGVVHVYDPKTLSLLFTFDCEAADDRFWNVSRGRGDVNRDGVADVLASGTGYSKHFSGRTGNLLRRFTDPQGSTSFGLALAILDDVDGDGSAETAIGTPDHLGSTGGTVTVFGGNDLYLRANEEIVTAGDIVTLTTLEDDPGLPTLLVLVGINGVALFQPIGGLGVFDSERMRALSGTPRISP